MGTLRNKGYKARMMAMCHMREKSCFWWVLKRNKDQNDQSMFSGKTELFSESYYVLSFDDLPENILHRFMCLNTWSLIVETVWERLGYVATLEEVCHSKQTKVSKEKSEHSHCSPALCLLLQKLWALSCSWHHTCVLPSWIPTLAA